MILQIEVRKKELNNMRNDGFRFSYTFDPNDPAIKEPLPDEPEEL